tara:strand:- start:471 stop:689 length:219 start_codon:yes stop_codon:yes gene_type:complete
MDGTDLELFFEMVFFAVLIGVRLRVRIGAGTQVLNYGAAGLRGYRGADTRVFLAPFIGATLPTNWRRPNSAD